MLSNRSMSSLDVAAFAHLVFFRYLARMSLRCPDFSKRWRKGSSSALSCGLSLRIIQAISPPVRTVAPEFGMSLGKIFFQKSAM